MPSNFKIPFLKSSRNSLAIELTFSAKSAAERSNKARTISDFIYNYDIVLDCFSKLARLNGKVSSVKGNLKAEYYRLDSEFQKHLHDAIDRSGDEIVIEHKGLYKYDVQHTKQRILQFKNDITSYSSRFDTQNIEFSQVKYSFVCHSCNMECLLEENSSIYADFDELFCDAVEAVLAANQASAALLQRQFQIGYARAARIIDEMERAGVVGPFEGSRPRKILLTPAMWKNRTSTVGYVHSAKQIEECLSEIDTMEGHEFEYWCAEVLRNNGFNNVYVTQGSGDQGVDVIAQKDGIKYAIQCKCYSSDIGNSPIQEVTVGKAIYHCHVGAVMTNRYFTAGAKQAAEATGILLWDRAKLAELIKNTNTD